MALLKPKTPATIASLWTFAFAFAGTALMLLTGWLADVASWLASDDEAVVFPSMAPLVKVAVALFLAGVIAAGNFLYRWLQTKDWFRRFLPGAAPSYDS